MLALLAPVAVPRRHAGTATHGHPGVPAGPRTLLAGKARGLGVQCLAAGGGEESSAVLTAVPRHTIARHGRGACPPAPSRPRGRQLQPYACSDSLQLQMSVRGRPFLGSQEAGRGPNFCLRICPRGGKGRGEGIQSTRAGDDRVGASSGREHKSEHSPRAFRIGDGRRGRPAGALARSIFLSWRPGSPSRARHTPRRHDMPSGGVITIDSQYSRDQKGGINKGCAPKR